MFDSLTEKLSAAFKRLRSRGALTPEDVQVALRDVRMALLEADVNFRVVKDFIARVTEKATGRDVLESLTPAQQVIKIVHDEMVELLGGQASGLALAGKPPVPVMLVGLQGSGKTTTAAKLARFLREKQGRRPYLASVDVYRPAAIEQLKTLARQVDVPCFDTDPSANPVEAARQALRAADAAACDTLLLDTAGRLHVDERLMQELRDLKAAIQPREVLLVVDAMTGQDAVTVAKAFNEGLGFDGVVMTKLDGDARGGAALSVRAVTGRPLKLVGVGEKVDALEVFHPERMASRILGMGDVLTLIEKAQQAVEAEQARELERKLRKNQFTLEDFREQLQQVRKMGPIESLLGMIPGFDRLKGQGIRVDERELVRVEAIINSMTPQERRNHAILNGSRRKRIARGSGTTVEEVNRLVKRYLEARKMMMRLSRGGMKALRRSGRLPFA
ncbi:MAG TPA: signal recognition particle protein [Thermodesulfobacteriota bacterium]